MIVVPVMFDTADRRHHHHSSHCDKECPTVAHLSGEVTLQLPGGLRGSWSRRSSRYQEEGRSIFSSLNPDPDYPDYGRKIIPSWGCFFERTPPWLYHCMIWILFGDIVPFEASPLKCVSMVPSSNIKTMPYCQVKVFTCTLKHKNTTRFLKHGSSFFWQPPLTSPYLPIPPVVSVMKQTGNLNGRLCTFETISMTTIFVLWF